MVGTASTHDPLYNGLRIHYELHLQTYILAYRETHRQVEGSNTTTTTIATTAYHESLQGRETVYNPKKKSVMTMAVMRQRNEPSLSSGRGTNRYTERSTDRMGAVITTTATVTRHGDLEPLEIS